MWQAEEVRSDWRRGAIVKLPQKGNISDCNNWRGITLLSIPGNMFCSSVLLNRLREHVDNILREEQAGFRKGRSSSEQIFTLWTIIEQSIEHQTPLIFNFIDFKKAFDSIHRESLWKILKLYGVSDKFINIFKTLYLNSSCCVKTSVGNTEMFDITTGVRQDCILSPFLFLIIIDFIMTKAMDDAIFLIEWGQKRLADLVFADDISAISHTLAGIQEITNTIETFGANIGLRINCEKTKAMKIGPEQHPPPSSCNRTWTTPRSFHISWKLHVKRRRFRTGCTRQDRKRCIHFPTASFYTVINYHQLECKVTSVHSHCDPHGNLCV